MNNIKKSIIFLQLFVSVLILPKLYGATRVVDNSGTTGTLQAKWSQTMAAGLKQNKSFWLAYSVDKLMPENRYFVSTAKLRGCIQTPSISTLAALDGIPLGKLIYGKDAKILKPIRKEEQELVKEAAKRALSHAKNKHRKDNYKKVKKEVAVLVLFKPGLAKEPEMITLSNMSIPFESNGMPIYWLGKTDENKSLQLLTGLFTTLDGDKAKRRLLSVVGNHTNTRQVVPFLAKVVDSDETDTVRSKAAGELGDQDNPSAIDILLNTAKKDHSLKVRQKAVNALEDLDFPAAVDALIDIAKTANNTNIRQKAINTLGDVGTKKAAEALYDIVFKDIDINIQRRAVNAFEDLHDNNGVPYLIKIAKTHPKPYIRKKAIDCLTDIKDPRAFEAIKAIAKEK